MKFKYNRMVALCHIQRYYDECRVYLELKFEKKRKKSISLLILRGNRLKPV